MSARAPAPPDAAYAWWTDYRETDHDGRAFKPFRWRRREILARDESGRVTRLRDVGRGMGYDTTCESLLTYEPPRTVIQESTGPVGDFVTRYAFESAPGGMGTLVSMTVGGEVTAPWAIPFAKTPGFLALVARMDLEAHVREMKRDLAARKP